MKKTNIIFDAMREKGNNTGLAKNSNISLQSAMVQAVKEQLEKIGEKSFRCVFHVDGKLYQVFMNAETMLQRCKLESDEKSLKVFAPISRPQAVEMVKDLKAIGEMKDLEEVKAKSEKKLNNGQAVEYFLARKFKKPFDHVKPWYEKGGEFGSCEVKFFDFGNGCSCSSPRCRLTNRKQLEKLGYSF